MSETETKQQLTEVPIKKPDEDAGFLVEDFLKISDPETGETIYEGRG